MSGKDKLGKLIQFPVQKSLDTPPVDSLHSVNDEVTEQVAEKYNYYRDIYSKEAEKLANYDGPPVEFDPLEKAIQFQEISKMRQGMERHTRLGDFLAELNELIANLRMTTPIVIYAITMSRHNGTDDPDLFQLVRYEGLLQDLVKDKSYLNWDEVMNSDVDVDEEPANMPDEFYISLLPCVQDKVGTWKIKAGEMAIDVPFSQILALRHAKSPIPEPRQV